MFDEPVNGLDPDGIRWIRDLMRNLAAEGRTVFLSSHLMSEMMTDPTAPAPFHNCTTFLRGSRVRKSERDVGGPELG
jgi:ABC-type Na+ transport system ATPase subunit NatA